MNKGAKITGLLVFVGGIVLMGLVFMAALKLLNDSRTAPTQINQLPREGLILLARVGFLFVMGYIASAVSGRGIQLFEATATEMHREDTSRT